MIRLLSAYFPKRTLLLGAAELLLVALAFVAATVLTVGLKDSNLVFLYERGMTKIGVVVAVLLVCMYYFDLYDSEVIVNNREVAVRLIQVIGTGCIILGAITAWAPQLGIGHRTFLFGMVIAPVLIVFSRKLFIALTYAVSLSEPIVIMGDGPFTTEVIQAVQRRPELGCHLVGYVNAEPSPEGIAGHLDYLGNIDDLEPLVREGRVNRVIVTLGDRRGTLPVDRLLWLKTQGLTVQDGAEFYETISGRLPLRSLRLSWLLFSRGFQPTRGLLLYKRGFSFLLSSILMVLTFPLMLLIALAIRLDSPGPALFRQKRVGKDGKEFILYKFRSMVMNADNGGKEAPAQHVDPRVTRVGYWLRRLRLDELPQILNIFKGELYFVGPRPFVPSQEYELAEKIPFYRQRWTVRPGATGWAQVNRGYNATIEENTEKLEYDLYYIKNMSVGLDFLILIKTIKILLLGRGGR